MSGFELDPAVLDSAAGTLDGVGTTLAGRTDATRGAVQGAGNPWGSDEPGSAFGQLYVAIATSVLDTAVTHHDELTYASEALRTWRHNLVATDEASATRFDTLGRGL